MKNQEKCYRCQELAETREHIPPKSFFPDKGRNLQMKTVPSCKVHNNDKSNDDQYLLAHICINAASEDNLAKKVFMRSIAPQLKRSEKFRQNLAIDSVKLPDGSVLYKTDVLRFDNFFDHLSYALYFDKFSEQFDESHFKVRHIYLDLQTKDLIRQAERKFVIASYGKYFQEFDELITKYEADKIDEVIYQNKIIAPLNQQGSITIFHTFYGVFNVVSLLTRSWR
jgi:hypothetical protein